MKQLTHTELKYLESLLFRINKFRDDLVGTNIHEEIKILKEIHKRKYIDTEAVFGETARELYKGESDLINSWKSWYISKNKYERENL